MVGPLACEVCGHQSPAVRLGLVHWRPATDDGRPLWQAVPRCPDRTQCAQRVRDAHQPWPLVETDRSILAILGDAAPPPADRPERTALAAATLVDDDPRAWW